MLSLRNLLIMILLAALFIAFKPQIMQWFYVMKNEFAPMGIGGNATYQEFKRHDIYKREKAIDKTYNEMSGGTK